MSPDHIPHHPGRTSHPQPPHRHPPRQTPRPRPPNQQPQPAQRRAHQPPIIHLHLPPILQQPPRPIPPLDVLPPPHPDRQRHGQRPHSPDAARTGRAEQRGQEGRRRREGCLWEDEGEGVRARRSHDGADDGAGLETAVEDVRGQDGGGVGLVFGVGGVGPELRHFCWVELRVGGIGPGVEGSSRILYL